MHDFKKNIILCLAVAFLIISYSQNSLADPHEWELQLSEDGIEVFTKVVEGAQIKAFKATTVVDVPLQSVLTVVGDATHYPDWFHLCKSYEFIEQPGTAGDYISYYVVNAPWPLKDRDIYTKNVISQDPDTLIVTIQSTGVPEYAPEKKEYTRVPEVSAHWTFKPLNDHQTYVEMIGHGYPGGIIPVWIANLVVTDIPKKSFQNLHDLLKDSKYDLAHASQLKTVFTNIEYPATVTSGLPSDPASSESHLARVQAP